MPFISEVEAIFIQRFYTGWISLRNQLTTPIKLMGRRVIELYDALIAGNDWEVTPFLSLKRRAGHTLYTTILAPALNMYSWKTNTMGTIPIIDTTADFESIVDSTVTSIYTKPASTQAGLLGIGNYLYLGAGTNKKWDGPSGTQGITNWGISIGSFSGGGGGQGPAPAGSGTDQNLGANNPWTNPGNVTSPTSYATASVTSTVPNFTATDNLLCQAFSFSITVGTVITGIAVTFDELLNNMPTGTNVAYIVAFLLKNGVSTGAARITPNLSNTSVNTLTLGGMSDLWGTTWAASDTDSATFGVMIYAAMTRTGGTPQTIQFSLRNVNIQIFAGGTNSVSPTGSGSFSAVNGYSYVIAYGNATSGEISNGSAISANTGPFTNVAYVAVDVIASTDPQVNQIRVYRTTDSGGGNQFFEISNSPFPNTTTTIQDTTPDLDLQVTSQAEINLGNTPPPANLVNLEWFAGRMWGSVYNLLYASTGAETISGEAPNSNWNPQFQWVIPGVIVRNVTGPNGMLVFMQDDCYIVRGTDITNYTVNEFVKDFGVRTYNAVDTDGTNLYVFTSDRQFILVSASGAQDIGLPIGDQLLNVDPTQVYVKVNRYGLDSIVRILDTVNNVYYDYNLNQQCWNLPGILQMPATSAMGSIEVSPGVWRLLLCSTNATPVSSLAYRDISNFQDLGTSYAPNAVFGSIQLADPGTLAKFGACGGFAMQYTNAGTIPTLSILPNDIGCTMTNAVGSQITGTFTNLSLGTNPFPIPPTLGNKPTGYRNLGYYYLLAKGLSAFVQNLQFKLSAPAENTATELIGFGIYGDMKQEVETPGVIPQIQGR